MIEEMFKNINMAFSDIMLAVYGTKYFIKKHVFADSREANQTAEIP